MSDLAKHMAELTPEKRKLVAQKLQRKLLSQQLQKNKEGISQAHILPQERSGTAFPLSFAQRRLWFLQQLEPQSAFYNIPLAFRLTGWLHVDVLERSLALVVQRHEVLRTTFPLQQEQPIQVVAPSLPIQVVIIDLHILSAAQGEAPATQGDDILAIQGVQATGLDRQVVELVHAEAQRPFDLTCGPLLRVRLLRLGKEEHILLLTLHHIVADGWSCEIFMRELALLYQAQMNGEAAGANSALTQLPDLPIQYADYTLWQQQWSQGEVLESQLAYWRQQLAGIPALLELPTDRPRPAVQRYVGAQQVRLLPPQLFAQLQSLSQREGVTLFMTLLATFQVLLMRYSGQHDIVVGTPIANRTREELEGLIGFFINTLVLRTDLSGNPSFKALIARVREVALQAYAHQDLPFEKLVEDLQPERDLSHQPLFQVLFSLQNTPPPRLELLGISVSPMPVESQTAKFDLSLRLTEDQAGLQAVMEYNTDLFDAASVTRMLGHWQVLLNAIVHDPGQAIEALPLLTQAEREQLLVEWNATGAQYDYQQELCLHQLVEQQAEQTPEAIAVVFDDVVCELTPHLTYHKLNDQANQLAHRLQGRGIGPDVLVGVCMERSLEMVVALLAVLKAGGAYVPLDPNYPQERLTFLLEDAQIPVVLTQAHLCDLMGQARKIHSPSELICLDLDTPIETSPTIGASPMATVYRGNPACSVQPENLAYLIYTSGSTGQPKGAMNTHQGICNRLSWMQQVYQLTPDDRVLQKTPFSFDVSVWEFFWPLTTGACMIVAYPGGHRDPAYLNALVAQQQVTTLHFVPSMLQAFLVELNVQTRGSLRHVICSGETLSAELAARFFAHVPEEVQLHNLYGPTEAAIDVTFWPCLRETVDRSVPIGRPIANTQIYLLDRNLEPVPIGVAGELYIGGEGLARGYYRRTDLTAERFVANPFVGAAPCACPPGTRLYRTGDLACYRADGAIEYLGRIDSQIKLRGFRIELGEIEATLRACPGVQDAVVILREDSGPTGIKKNLVAYVVAASGANPEAAVEDYLCERLPDYMVPKSLVFLETLPLTPNGKVDRKALPPPSASGDNESTFVAPRSEMEQSLAVIWQEVLGLSQVSIHENFFALGGDSILSMLIIGRARQAGLELSPKQLFQHQTIAQLAMVARPIGPAGSPTGASPVPTAPDRWLRQAEVIGPVPLTPIQQWFFERNLQQPQHFNQAVMLQVPSVGTELFPVLQKIVDRWLIQHDALRLRYEYTETGWHQRLVSVAEAGAVTVERLDLTQVDASEQAKAIEDVANRVQASLDLKLGPLLRVVMFDLGNGQASRLLIVIHHLAVDGVSWRALLEDLQLAGSGAARGKVPVSGTIPTVSFQRWAEYLQELAQSALVQKERAYWLKVAQVVTTPLPRDFPEGSNTGAWARDVRTVLTREETRLLLQEAPRPYHSHFQELLLVALLQTLAGWIGTRQICLDLEGHGREELGDEALDVSRTVGWFTSLYPVLFTLPQDGGVDASIKAIKEQLRSVPHKGIGYGLLCYLNENSELREQLASSSEVSFNYLGQFDQIFSREEVLQPVGQAHTGETIGPQNQRSHLLDVSASISGGQLHLQWSYSEQLHHATTIERLAETLVQALRELLAHCLSPSAGGWTPSDFSVGQDHRLLDQAILDRLLAGRENLIEDLYPLTFLQQGLLFHTLYAPRSGIYIEQMSCVLRGEVELGAFERAWQQVIAQHAILRTAFVWQELREPLQIVFAQVKLPLSILDWRSCSSQQQEADLEAFLQADRAQGFDLGQAPLMRLTLIRLSETRTQMIWTHHHLLLDGWSLSLVLQEMLACYAAKMQGKSLVQEERRPYRDYISWLVQQEGETAEAYWRQTLAGIETPTPLGVDRKGGKPFGGDQSRQGYAEEALQVEASTAARWQKYARQQRVTLNTLMQAAWAIVLSRYSGQSDVVFGAVVAGRPPELAGVERMVGLFINTVPVRVQVHDEEAVGVWLTRLQERQIEQRPYEYSSLALVQGWCSHRTGESGQEQAAVPTGPYSSDGIAHEHPVEQNHSPLFESLFVFENYPGQDALWEHVGAVQALEVEMLQVAEQTNYPLTIVVVPGTDGEQQTAEPAGGDKPTPFGGWLSRPLHLRVSYDRERFERATIERLLLHMQTVLQQLVTDPQQKLGAVSLLTPRERKQLLMEWNDTSSVAAGVQCDYPQDLCLHQLFEQQVEQTPDAVALVFEDAACEFTSHLTYQQLNERANQLAQHLHKRGIGPQGLVALCVERSLEMVIGLLGILKADCAYVPLDPAYPKPRLAFMLDDANIEALITQQRLFSILPLQKNVVCLDTDWSLIAQESKENSAAATSESLLSIIYTSGSTGQPKGVLGTHRSTINRLRWMWTTYPFHTEEACCQKTALSFVDSVWEIFGPLLKGIRTIIIPENVVKDPKGLLYTLATHGITRLVLVPSLLRALLETTEKLSGVLPNLKYCVCSGEALPLDLARRFLGDMPECVLLNLYGSSEVAADVTYSDTRQDYEDLLCVPIGRPIANTQIYLLDRNLQPVPVGIPAEVFIGGVNLAWGYQNRADLTAERFIPHPFGGTGGERLYRTGDLARYRADGTLEYLGRIDQQVKLRGFRIELGEIEATLQAHPGVKEAVVVLQEEDEVRKYLAAYVVVQAGESLTLEQVQEYLREQLPDYMLPSRAVFLEALPLTPNGKVDRKALSIPDWTRQDRDEAAVQARTPIEEVLATIWATVLGRERVSIHDNFFEVGGHSLLVTQLIAQIRVILGVEIPLRAVFESSTVAGLALLVEQSMRKGEKKQVPPLVPATSPLVGMERPEEIPLSLAQQRLWFLDQLEPGNTAYLVPSVHQLHGMLDVHCFERSLQELIDRHESLRTTFAAHAGNVVQVIHEACSPALSVIDLQGLMPEGQEEETRRLARQEAAHSCDLARGPLLRTSLLRLAREEHVLLLTLHHIITDGWSMGVLVRELSTLYRAFVSGQPSPLAPLPVQYADYTLWQRQWLQGQVLEAQILYWKKQLAEVSSLAFPSDYPRPTVQTYRGAIQELICSPELSEQVLALSRREKVTLFMTLLAAFQVLLARYTGQSDICVGSPIANRRQAEIEGLIGFFVNTLVLRTDLSGNPTFEQVLRRVREVCLGAYVHQDVPFEKVVEELHPERFLSHSPLFNVMVVMENFPYKQPEELSIEPLAMQNETSKVDLTLYLVETEQGLSCAMSYNTDLFTAETISRLLNHWQTLLQGLVDSPQIPIWDVPLLTDDEREQLLVEWNATQTDDQESLCIHQLFEQQVERMPDAIAVVFEEAATTYRELDTRANQLAHYLRSCGVGPEVLVGVCLERSLEMVMALLGILKAGGTYVPLDPTYPHARLAFMMQDSQITLLLTQSHLQAHLPVGSLPIFCLDSSQSSLALCPRTKLESLVQPDNPAYVVYTSGSTGTPKGVITPHRGVVNYLSSFITTYPLDGGRVLQLPSISFEPSIRDIIGPLVSGASTILLPPSEAKDPLAIVKKMSIYAITSLLSVVPSLLRELQRVMAETHISCPTLHTILANGETLHLSDFREVQALIDEQAVFVNQYGPTECPMVSSCYTVSNPAHETREHLPIGRPLSNRKMYILDTYGHPVPVGVTGELYIGGKLLSRGYLGQPALTAERFLPNPFVQAGPWAGPQGGELLYKTGDLARYRADGNIEWLGRLDQQVKIRGYRIELGEIESVLQRHPAVHEAIVLAHEGLAGKKQLAPTASQLVAYVVLNQEPCRSGDLVSPGLVTSSDLRKYLQAKLPDYMVPSLFVMLDTLPLLPNGKVDRHALPVPHDLSSEHTGDLLFVEPRTQSEELLAQIWMRVLGCSQVSIHDNFFALGGHSLLATQVVSHIRQAIQIEFPLRTLFEAPTIAELAPHIEASIRGGTTAPAKPLPALVAHGASDECALSFAQERLWFLYQLEPHSSFYTLPYVLHPVGSLSLQALECSLATLVQRHEILRTTFTVLRDQPVQVIAPQLSIHTPLIDLSDLDSKEQKHQIHVLVQLEKQRPFDLATGPLLRPHILRLDMQSHILMFMMHHIISDGWSTGILARELTVLYQTYVGVVPLTGTLPCADPGRCSSEMYPSPLPNLPIQYRDYALWQRQWLQNEVLQEQLDYWLRQLKGAPEVLNLPTDRSRPAVQSYKGNRQVAVLPPRLHQALVSLGQREGTTLFMTLLAAYQVLLMRYSGQCDILVGTPIANRTRVELENLIGFLVNTLVMRTDLSGNPPFRRLLARVREVALGGFAHQDLPFEKLVDALQVERKPSFSPLFQVFFALQNAPEAEIIWPGLSFLLVNLVHTTARFDLALEMRVTEQGLYATVEYVSDLFDEATIQRLLTHWQVLLEAIVADPDQPIEHLPLLTEGEREHIRSLWACTKVPICGTEGSAPQATCLHELFELQAARVPDAIALSFQDLSLTYQELNQQANQLAHHLQTLAVGPDVVVGIFMERSLEMVIGILAILKAGGAFFPLDPSYPESRLAFMLEDAQPALVLTIETRSAQDTIPTAPPYPYDQMLALDTLLPYTTSAPNPTTHVCADNLAYLMYTSGSTGKPKGTMNTHRGICNNMLWKQDQCAFSQDDSMIQRAPLSFDASIEEIFLPLMSGGRLVLALPEGHKDSAYLVSLLKEQAITALGIVPSMLQVMLEERELIQCQGLRMVLCGGEAMPLALQERFLTYLPATLYNLYGPTEAAIQVTCRTCSRDRLDTLAVPIGYPIAHTQIYLLDAHLQAVPLGIPGELYIGGRNLGRGYFKRPDLTAERFIPNPFAGGERLYRTGDLARYRDGSEIEYLGRIDHQIKWRGIRVELGEIEVALKQHPAVQAAIATVITEPTREKRLAAYVILRHETAQPTQAETTNAEIPTALRRFLKEKLPAYMVPSAILVLDSLPLTTNGKIDRKALPVPKAPTHDEPTFVAPRSEMEQTLAAIWQQVLGGVAGGLASPVGIHDNFFEVGGDSILSIQITARARQAGLELTPKQLFQHQTIAQLATVARPMEATVSHRLQSEQVEMVGPVPLAPIQRRFFEQELPQPQHFNQAILLQVPASWDLPHLQQVVDALFVQHDALRLRYKDTETGWQQRLVSVAEAGPLTIERLDLTQIEASNLTSAIEREANRVQASLDIEHGPLLRVVLFELGHGRASRLLIVIHHLAIDGVSWRVLLSDLQEAMTQLQKGEPIALPAKTASFQRWAQHLQELAREASLVQQERAYWLRHALVPTAPLPCDFPTGSNTGAWVRTVSVTLTTEETRLLLQDACLPYHSQLQDLLLVALLQTLARWIGTQRIRLDLEGHGREELLDETPDVSRTVGWFTSLYPVLFTLPQQGGSDTWIKTIKEQLRSVPHKGIGYGLLRYLCDDPELREQLASATPSQVSFNYLGQFDQVLQSSSSREDAPQSTPESSGVALGPQNPRPHLLDVSALVSGDQLHLQWTYSEQLHKPTTIEALAQKCVQALRELLAHCLTPSAGGWTPSDFPLTSLDQTTIDRLLAGRENLIEDLYPLTPLQQGLLFHTLYAPRSGVYIEQMSGILSGEVKVGAFEWAWQQVITQHATLRTAFVWQELLREPLQIVFRQVKLPTRILDWRSRERSQQEADLQAFLQTDRAQGFDVGQAPLMRLTLVRLSETRTQVIWTHHHLLLDGWSLSLIFQEVLTSYKAEIQGQSLVYEERRPYRDYIRWLASQENETAETYWRQRLSGITAPTPLRIERNVPDPQGYAVETLQVEAMTAARWQEYAREQRVTLNTLMQAAWALVLSRYSGQADVVFGAVVAGRPPELSGVERMVGMFINTVPVRVQVHDEDAVGVWLTRLQEQQIEQQSYEYSPLVQIQEWCDIPHEHPLFESLFIFENYPVQDALSEYVGTGLALEVETVQVVEQTNYPLTIYVVPGASGDRPQPLLLRVSYDRQRFERATIERLLLHMQTVLQQLVADQERQMVAVSLLTPREREQLLVEWNAPSNFQPTGAQCDYPQEMTLHQLFEQQVERTPEAVALVFDVEYGLASHLTYRQLNEQANQLAQHLRKRGVGPQGRVALCVERSLEMVVGLLGILKADCAYVPLDPAYPKPRLAFMLDDAKIQAMVTQQRLLSILPPQKNMVCLDTDWSLIAQESKENNAAAISESLLSIIYTSGSTGQPKGVMATHHSTINRLHWMWTTYPFHAEEACCQKTALSFVDSVWEIFGPLLKGIRTITIPENVVKDPKNLLSTLATHGITRLVLVPSLLRALLETPEKLNSLLPNLKYCICSGETLPPDLARHFSDSMPECVLLNLYGSTEVAADVTCFDTRQDHEDLSCVPIGRPIANTQIYLLDRNLQPVPIGIAAEVFIGGVNLAWGYQNRADLTAERFVAHPWSTEPGARLYRTGDLARYRADGVIEYLGRRDQQVKLRGYRIELAEIEAALRKHPAIEEAVVLAREEEPGELVAYLVQKPDQKRIRSQEPPSKRTKELEFSLFYFANDAGEAGLASAPRKRYKLLLEGAKFADTHNFRAVWTPERHFHPFGGLYPNPSVTSAAIATITDKVQIRAGSVVLPLHDPVRVAEEWAVIDNLSEGRVGISFATGWIANDFVLAPEHYTKRKEILREKIETVRKLWRGEAVELPGPTGNAVPIQIYPQPIQPELPIWMTSSGNPETFVQAGEMGVNLLTHLLGQNTEELAEKIALYRQARQKQGHPGPGHVTLMLHTFLGTESASVREKVRQPFYTYLRSSFGLIGTLVESLGYSADLKKVTEEDLEVILAQAFERYAETSGLIGTVSTCLPMIERLKELGVDEVACLIDFGVEEDDVLASLHELAKLKEESHPKLTIETMGEGEEVVQDNSPDKCQSAAVGSNREMTGELRSHLQEHLPSFMIPTFFVWLDTLPLTPNGKIDRKALPILERREMLPEACNPLVAPQTPLQEQLALICAELLHLPQIGIHDNFFKLGGHSLLATRLMASLRTLFQVEIPLRYLFEKPTIAELALVIEQMQRAMLGQTEDERLAQMLIEMGGLSEDDMHAIFTDDQKTEKR